MQIRVGGIYDMSDDKFINTGIPSRNIKIRKIHTPNIVESVDGWMYYSNELTLTRKKKLERILK